MNERDRHAGRRDPYPNPPLGRSIVARNGHLITVGSPRKGGSMGIGVSLILIAVGAILTWAVNATVSGLDINTIGIILMIVGAIGLILSLMFWSSWGGVGATRRTTT